MRDTRWIVLVALIIACLGLAACGPAPAPLPATAEPEAVARVDPPRLNPTNTPQPVPTAEPVAELPPAEPEPEEPAEEAGAETPASPAARELLAAALEGVESDCYHFEMDVELTVSRHGVPTEMSVCLDGDFEPPDRMQTTVSVCALGQTSESEVITIGETTYEPHALTQEWIPRFQPAAPYCPCDFHAVDPSAIEDLTVVEQVTIEGTQVYHLQGTLAAGELGDAFADAEGDTTVEYWIAVGDCHLVREQIAAELSELNGAQVSIELKMSLNTSDYGEPVSVDLD